MSSYSFSNKQDLSRKKCMGCTTFTPWPSHLWICSFLRCLHEASTAG